MERKKTRGSFEFLRFALFLEETETRFFSSSLSLCCPDRRTTPLTITCTRIKYIEKKRAGKRYYKIKKRRERELEKVE